MIRYYKMWIRQKYELPKNSEIEAQNYLNELLARNSTILNHARPGFHTPGKMPKPGTLYRLDVSIDFGAGQFTPFVDSLTRDPYFVRQYMFRRIRNQIIAEV